MNTAKPLVSFIVPCYKLAHYLTECVDSILDQSFQDFEVLVMDDCSPDNTPQVASGIKDERVRYFRNNANLGHLRNYNVGIERARGKYLWLISADDRLRSRRILQRYVEALETDESIAFAFCAGMILTADGREGATTGRIDSRDRVFSSDEFVLRAIQENPVCTPGALARRSCYTEIGLFPLDLPFAGDWFLWCVFGAGAKVAYFEEPMVYYRLHGGSNTAIYRHGRAELIVHDEIDVRWRVLELARRSNRANLVAACHEAIARDYMQRLFKGRTRSTFGMSPAEFERSVSAHAGPRVATAWIRARVFELLGDECHERGELAEAKSWYGLSCDAFRRRTATVKHMLSRCGGPGLRTRNAISRFKRDMSRLPRHEEDRGTRASSPISGRPLVSIIIPCYNTAHFLRGALDSALEQTYKAIEIIVVNDGSTDNFAEVVAPYRARVKVIDQSNMGLSAARNRALEHGSGDLIAYLDADDQWHPSKLERQVTLLKQQPDLAFVHTGVDFIDELDRPLIVPEYRREFAEGRCLLQLARENSVIVSSVLHTRGALGTDRFEPHLTSAEDWDLWLRLAAKGPVGYIAASMTLYRRHANNMSKQKRLMLTNSLCVIAAALKRPQARAVQRNLLETRAELYRSLAHVEYEARNLQAARQLFWGGFPRFDRADTIRFVASSIGLSRDRLANAVAKLRSS